MKSKEKIFLNRIGFSVLFIILVIVNIYFILISNGTNSVNILLIISIIFIIKYPLFISILEYQKKYQKSFIDEYYKEKFFIWIFRGVFLVSVFLVQILIITFLTNNIIQIIPITSSLISLIILLINLLILRLLKYEGLVRIAFIMIIIIISLLLSLLVINSNYFKIDTKFFIGKNINKQSIFEIIKYIGIIPIWLEFIILQSVLRVKRESKESNIEGRIFKGTYIILTIIIFIIGLFYIEDMSQIKGLDIGNSIILIILGWIYSLIIMFYYYKVLNEIFFSKLFDKKENKRKENILFYGITAIIIIVVYLTIEFISPTIREIFKWVNIISIISMVSIIYMHFKILGNKNK